MFAYQHEHMETLRRLADGGLRWAADATSVDSPVLFASAGGFSRSFRGTASETGREIITWDADELFAEPEELSTP